MPDARSGRSSTHKDEEEQQSDMSGSDGDESTWVQWFCSLKGNEFFAEVEHEFMQDDFNLTGLSAQACLTELHIAADLGPTRRSAVMP